MGKRRSYRRSHQEGAGMSKLDTLLRNYTADRQLMNAAYAVYKDYSDRVKSYDSQIREQLAVTPLSAKEKKYLKDLIDESGAVSDTPHDVPF